MTSTGYQQIGRQLGRYEIREEIGRGGMGVVHLAYEPDLARHVALKLLPGDLADDPAFVARLRREAISAARLRHPNIALLYELGYAEGTAFLAMEYIPGPSLRQMLADGPLPPARALSILEQIAGALAAAHALGIVHRDVKPSNILVGPGDHAVLIDFGLADTAENSLLTADGAMLGTPHYMSPEQARGLTADSRSDQYALAAVAYELLTGAPPFQGRAAAVVHGHIYEPPPAPTERNPALPAAVDAALLRALAKAPESRFPSPPAFVAALRAAFERPRPARPAVRLPRLDPARLARATAAALVATLIAAGLWYGGRTAGDSQIALSSPLGVPLPRQVAWSYDPGLAGSSAPAHAAETVVFTTLDGALVALDADGGLRWRQDAPLSPFGAPAAGAGRIFVGNADGVVFGIDPSGGATLWRQRVAGAVREAPLRSNDRLIVTTGAGYVYVLHAGSGAVAWGRPLASGVRGAAVGAGSLFVTAGRSIYALDINTGATRWKVDAPGVITTPPSVGAGLVVFGTERGVLVALSAEAGEERFRHQARGPISAAPVFDPDALYLADHAGTLTAISLADGQNIWRFETGRAIVATPLLADGKLVFGTSAGSVFSLDARSGRQLASIQLDGSASANPALGPEHIYIAAGRIYALGP